MTEADAAFIRAEDGYEFAGKRLHKFTPLRQCTADIIGLYINRVSDDERWSIEIAVADSRPGKKKNKPQTESLPLYNGIMQDAALVLWLCSISDAQCLKARRKKEWAETESARFAGETGILISNPQRRGEAIGAFYAILSDIAVSTGVPDVPGGIEDDDPND